VKGDLDDGRGKARVNLFRHQHEIETGRTSSVGMEIMGFDSKGQVVTSDTPGRRFLYSAVVDHQSLGTDLHRKIVVGGYWQAKRQSHHLH
jgi:GTPase